MFVLDSDGTDCPTACTATHQCTDTEASTFEDFIVSADPVLEGIEEDVGVNDAVCRVTSSNQWEKIDENNLPDNFDTARVVEPIPWTGDSKDFTIEATPEEIESFKDECGEISFKRTLMWSLPRFCDNKNLFEWQA